MAYTKQNYQPGDVLTAEQMNKIQDVVIVNEGNIEGHIENKENPHGVTIEQIGAAPSGFGLGDVCVIQDLSSVTKTGWYKGAPGYVCGVPQSYYTDFWYCSHIEAGVNNSATQRAYYNPIVYPNCEIVRTKNSDGTWSEWEWGNPPMIPGVEYRTTERWNGKVVWKIALDFGALPNNGQKHIATPINGLDDYVRFFLKTNDGKGNHRYIAGSSDGISIHVLEGWKLVVITTADYGGLGGVFEIHYTKH